MRRTIVPIVLALFLASSLLVGGTAAAQNDDRDNDRDAPDCPQPGFVSGLVQDITPDFLKDLISSLPVPSFVESFFGIGDDC